MALTDMVIMPGADYQAVCDAIREKTGSAGYLRSGELAAAILSVSGGAGISATLPKGRMKGDVNGDGVVDATDKSEIDQYVAGLPSVLDNDADGVAFWCADVNDDGAINTVGDSGQLGRYINGMIGALTSKPTMADYYGNWTYVKVDDVSGYFYYDVEAPDVTADSSVTLLVSGHTDCFMLPECMAGAVRIKVSRLPVEDVECCIVEGMEIAEEDGGGRETVDALIDRTITEVTTGVEIIGMYAFYYCDALTKADLKNAKEIRNYAFYATMLDTLILRRTDAVCAVKGDMAIEGSNLSVYNGYIYVPAALVSSYQADEFWSGYDWMIRALEDYTVDGTVTGALDETKIGEE